MNNAIVNKIFNPNVRFKTVDKTIKNNNENNETCNNTIKTHHEMNFHSETTIPLSNNQRIFNLGQFSDRNSNLFRKKNQKTIIKEGPYQVDQNKLDKVFKRSYFY